MERRWDLGAALLGFLSIVSLATAVITGVAWARSSYQVIAFGSPPARMVVRPDGIETVEPTGRTQYVTDHRDEYLDIAIPATVLMVGFLTAAAFSLRPRTSPSAPWRDDSVGLQERPAGLGDTPRGQISAVVRPVHPKQAYASLGPTFHERARLARAGSMATGATVLLLSAYRQSSWGIAACVIGGAALTLLLLKVLRRVQNMTLANASLSLSESTLTYRDRHGRATRRWDIGRLAYLRRVSVRFTSSMPFPYFFLVDQTGKSVLRLSARLWADGDVARWATAARLPIYGDFTSPPSSARSVRRRLRGAVPFWMAYPASTGLLAVAGSVVLGALMYGSVAIASGAPH